MADGRSQVAWSHTSTLMAHLANINRDPEKKREPFKPSDFNPLIAKPDKPIARAGSMRELKGLLLGTASTLEESRKQAET